MQYCIIDNQVFAPFKKSKGKVSFKVDLKYCLITFLDMFLEYLDDSEWAFTCLVNTKTQSNKTGICTRKLTIYMFNVLISCSHQ